ncbi:exosome component CSL4 [Novymonas esmeraldas]|uniref:Exosome component CSL4 n=1 Tax=Novymonas esmeraldas TaxID=1808958 RepID=A0AAW0ERD4_9TRYP
MPVVQHTGTRVAPGDSLFTSVAGEGTSRTAQDGEAAEDGSDVLPGEGCVVQYVEQAPSAAAAVVERRIVAVRHGVAQWDGRVVSVFALAPRAPTSSSAGAPGASLSSPRTSVVGPRPGDTVHLRVTRLNRLFAFGEIIAVNWRWCSHGSLAASASGAGGAFKGVLRQEDIRPFRPTKEQLLPPPPSLAFGLGDVVVAEVISQSDAHQYQLSTTGDGCGVVEAFITAAAAKGQYGEQEKMQLQHIPGRRDAMMAGDSGAVVPRWCPLLP